jgi:hypothetical protein
LAAFSVALTIQAELTTLYPPIFLLLHPLEEGKATPSHSWLEVGWSCPSNLLFLGHATSGWKRQGFFSFEAAVPPRTSFNIQHITPINIPMPDIPPAPAWLLSHLFRL